MLDVCTEQRALVAFAGEVAQRIRYVNNYWRPDHGVFAILRKPDPSERAIYLLSDSIHNFMELAFALSKGRLRDVSESAELLHDLISTRVSNADTREAFEGLDMTLKDALEALRSIRSKANTLANDPAYFPLPDTRNSPLPLHPTVQRIDADTLHGQT